MKKHLLIFTIISAITISCNNDDNGVVMVKSNNLEKDIIGKWVPYEIKVNNVVKKYDDHESCGLDYLQFSDHSIYKYVDIFDCKEEVENGTYSLDISNKQLTVKSGVISTKGSFEIYTSPKKVLVIEFIYDYDDDGKNDNVATYYDFQMR